MSLFDDYLAEIEERKKLGLKPKPIDDGMLTAELIGHITDVTSPHRAACLDFLVYNTLPGTTSAAGVKAKFLKDIIQGNIEVAEISAESASLWKVQFPAQQHIPPSRASRSFRLLWQ